MVRWNLHPPQADSSPCWCVVAYAHFINKKELPHQVHFAKSAVKELVSSTFAFFNATTI